MITKRRGQLMHGKPTSSDWFLCAGTFVVGAAICWLYVDYPCLCQQPIEDDLFAVQGIPAAVRETKDKHLWRLRFALMGHQNDYTSDQPNYKEVLAAVQSGQPIEAWLSTQAGGRTDIFKLSVAGRTVVAYSESMENRTVTASGPLFLGCCVLAMGGWVLFTNMSALRRASTPGLASTRSPKGGIAAALVLYAIIIYVNLDPSVHRKQVEAFGQAPFGLPVTLVVSIVETILFTPVPWILVHVVRVALQAVQEGRSLGVSYVLTVGDRHPHLRWSQFVCILGFVYLIVICGAWIVYAAVHRI